jgi:protein-disulfide isomerase
MFKKISIEVIVIAILAVGWQLLPNTNKQTASTQQNESSSTTTQTAIQDDDLIIGNKTAQATITEYGDFKCPSCGQFHQEAGKQLRNGYIKENKLKIVFRPIAVIGPDSERSAIGAYCAQTQNKFTEYHDSVYNYMWDNYYKARNFSAEYQDILTSKLLSTIANEVGLDTATFESCLNESSQAQRVANNQKTAQEIGVRGTPTFSINNQLVVGPQPYNVFKSLVDIQLKQ